MPVVEVTQKANINLSDLWSSWDAFADIYKFHPTVNNSYIINGSRDTGLGAERQCDVGKKDFLREKIIGYEPEKRIEIDIYETSMPIKDAVAVFDFKAHGPNASQVTMKMTFTPKMGVLNPIMTPLMKMQMRGVMQKMLSANAKHVEDATFAPA